MNNFSVSLKYFNFLWKLFSVIYIYLIIIFEKIAIELHANIIQYIIRVFYNILFF